MKAVGCAWIPAAGSIACEAVVRASSSDFGGALLEEGDCAPVEVVNFRCQRCRRREGETAVGGRLLTLDNLPRLVLDEGDCGALLRSHNRAEAGDGHQCRQ